MNDGMKDKGGMVKDEGLQSAVGSGQSAADGRERQTLDAGRLGGGADGRPPRDPEEDEAEVLWLDRMAEARAVGTLRRLAEKAKERLGLAGVPLYVWLDLRMGLSGVAPVWRARWLCGCDIVHEGPLDECLRVLAVRANAEFMRYEARRHRELADEWDRRADDDDARAREAKGEGNE